MESWITFIGLLAAFCTTIALLPQVIKILRTKETRDISLGMYLLMIAGIVLWIVYGMYLNDLPIVAANGATLALAAMVLYYKIKYG